MLRVALGIVLSFALSFALPASDASAQRMDLALSRLRIVAEDREGTPCSTRVGDRNRQFCADEDSWRRLASQFAGSLIPPLLAPARTRGQAGFYVGIESFITGIDASQEYWHRGVEGDEGDAVACGGGTTDPGTSCRRSRFVDGVLGWTRLNFRKGLPFGFELGTNVGFLTNTSYWTLGLDIRWALFEGFRRDGLEFLPNLAVRGAVQTLLGDQEFNMTVPSVDVTLSWQIIIASVVELQPFISGQLAWIFADTELVDLTPERDAYAECMPPPGSSAGSCLGNPDDYNHNRVFPRLRSMRGRLGAGLQLRYEWFTVSGSFAFDLAAPHELDTSLPELPRQYQASVGLGLSY